MMRFVLPGFKRGITITILWLVSMLIVPLSLLILSALQLESGELWAVLTSPRVLASIGLSFKMAFFATLINLVFGVLLAWILVRYDFWGRKVVNAFIDLPFALPTAVAGIALASLYSPKGLIGGLFEPLGIQIAYTPLGIMVALVFVSLPFIVRAVQPVLASFDPSLEEAAEMLGASKITVFKRVFFPNFLPALIGGAGMGFARSLGEYGSVIFIAGNVPMVSEIAPLVIMSKLELFDVKGASAIALLMLVISFLLILIINFWQWKLAKRISPTK